MAVTLPGTRKLTDAPSAKVGRRRNTTTIVEEPVPYRPRPAKHRIVKLLSEFERRVGDPNVGGSSKGPIVTAYRQDALRVAGMLAGGPMRLADLRGRTGIADTARILQRDVYGWFERLCRGTYGLSEAGRLALERYADAAAALAPSVEMVAGERVVGEMAAA